MNRTYFEILYEIFTRHFWTPDFFLHQILWRQQQRDKVQKLLFKVGINVCVKKIQMWLFGIQKHLQLCET